MEQEQPHNIFAFEVNLTLYIFVAYGNFSAIEFTDYVDKASLSHIPDKVALFYHEDILKEEDLLIISDHLQFRFRCTPSFFKFDRVGQFSIEDPLVDQFLADGKEQIIRLRKPILLPPPGKSFIKPSGSRESFFIQASNLFLRHAEMSYVALLLIREWGHKFDESVKVIYVDTIDLYGLTSLASRMRFSDRGLGPITVSYSSYAGFKQILKHADVRNSLMVISATTSHNLLRDITVQTRWKETDRVVTVLDLDPKIHAGDRRTIEPKVIAYVKPPDADLHINHLLAIRLSGEKFTVEVDQPKSVTLKSATHGRCLTHLKLSKLMQMRDIFSAYDKSENSRLPIAIDRKALVEHTVFREWLRAQIEKYAPASTTHVVLADVDKSQVRPLLGIFGRKTLHYVTPGDLRDSNTKVDGSVIVISPSFSTGSKLLEISRDLRKQPKLKNVVYFTGIGTPESRADFDKLRKNLEIDGFRIVSFCNVATGPPRSLALSWRAEQELIRSENGLNEIVELQKRAQILEDGKLSDANLFYRVEDLEFHQGFKYWEGLSYNHVQPARLLLFTTLAFLFQDARTNSLLTEEDRLVQLPNRRVLLDPENFFRYNDSLIQVSILRAAFPSEIDYSDHEIHSRSILYLFQRVEQVSNRSMVYEMLLALATKRLQVTREKLSEIKRIVEGSSLEECQWFASVSLFGPT